MACIAQLLYPPPTKRGWEEWLAWHSSHHDAIERGLASVLGVQPMSYQLYPMYPDDTQHWLEIHQQAHSRFGQLLQVETPDLGNLDFNNKSAFDDWVWLNYIGHLGAAQRLGTTIT